MEPVSNNLSNKSPRAPQAPRATRPSTQLSTPPTHHPRIHSRTHQSITFSIDRIPILLTLADTGTYYATGKLLNLKPQTVKDSRLIVERYYTKPIFTISSTTLPCSTTSSRTRVKPHNPTYQPFKQYDRLVLTPFGQKLIPVLRKIHELNLGIWQGIVTEDQDRV